MTYTTHTHIGAVTVQHITPLRDETVHCIFSSAIAGYKAQYTDTALTLHTQLAFAGTKKYTQEALVHHLKQHGITLSVTHHNGVIHYACSMQQSKLPRALKVLHEILYEPTFPKKQFDEMRAVLYEKNRELTDDAKYIATTNFVNTLYDTADIAYTETPTIQKKNLAAIKKPLLRKLQRDILAGTWTVSVVGNTAAAQHVSRFAKTLAKTASTISRPDTTHTSLVPKTGIYTTIPGKTNVELRIGNRLPITPHDDSYAALVFGLMVLGNAGGFSGRLMSTVREKEGLTYGIYTTTKHTARTSTGHWFVYTFFTGKDLQKGIASTMREIRTIVTKGVTEEEMTTFKEIITNTHLLAHDSNDARLTRYHFSMLAGLDEAALERQRAAFLALTRKEVHTALATYLDPDKLVISGAGPVTKKGAGITT